MKSLVIYFSQTGNTRKIAEAIYSGIGSASGHGEIASIMKVDASRLSEFDLIGLGSPVHYGTVPRNVKRFVLDLPMLERKHCFLFATHGPNPGTVFGDAGRLLSQKGAQVIGCRRWYGTDWVPAAPKPYFTDGHPDTTDIKEAAVFGEEMVECSVGLACGETRPTPNIMAMKEQIFPPPPAEEIRLNRDKCRYPICRLCADNCPVDCIDLSGQAATFNDLEKCIQCWFCDLICPTGAIEVDWEPKARLFKEGTLAALPLLEKAKAQGRFRSLVDVVDMDVPAYKVDKRPLFAIQASPCALACPINVNVPEFQSLAAEGRFELALGEIRRANPFPSICGRICYHPCEGSCRRQHVDQAVGIAALERFVADQADLRGIAVPQIGRNGRTVAIIGSGPAGLTAAHDLALMGYSVTVFEALPEPGGMLRIGIPQYRLPRQVLDNEISCVERLGVQIRTGMRIGDHIELEDIRRTHEALFVATGAQQSLRLGVDGEESRGVVPALEFLKVANSTGEAETGDRVVVVGGGNAGIDAARVARRFGRHVTIVYHRSRAEMPAMPTEVSAAAEEGVEFVFLATPAEIAHRDGRVIAMKCIRTTLGAPDASGRKEPIPVEGSEFTIEVDTVMPAVGQTSDLRYLEEKGMGLEVSTEGKMVVDPVTLSTNVRGIFAGGDVATGTARVVDAIAAGKRAARSIDAYLQGIPLWVGQTGTGSVRHELTREETQSLTKMVVVKKRVETRELAAGNRVRSFAEVALGLDVSQFREEAGRCLKCNRGP